MLTNGKVEALDIVIQDEKPPEIQKRKRGRPKTKIESQPPVKEIKSTKSSTDSTVHKKKKPPKKDYCKICDKVINHNMKGHQAIHDRSETYSCDICGFETNVKLYLKNHMNKIHVAIRYLPPSSCEGHNWRNEFLWLQKISMPSLPLSVYAFRYIETTCVNSHWWDLKISFGYSMRNIFVY